MSVEVFFTDDGGPKLHSAPPYKDSPRFTLEYLNEGGANFVFHILPDTISLERPSRISGKLLRLRKHLPHVKSAKEQITAFNEHFKPLFPPENLVQYELIELDRDFAELVNVALKSLDRPLHRILDLMPVDDTCGLLVTDMTPREGDILLQLKPKWMAQSPSAPPDAKRCRTCALRALRASQKVRTATDAQENCPLALISDSSAEKKRSAESITSNILLQEFLIGDAQPLLHTLRSCQMKLDPIGILDGHSAESILDYCKAMTLRDCTLFIKRSESHIEARLADLDLKQPEKLSTWQNTEQRLVVEGWYTNTETAAKWSKEHVCLLSM